MSRLTKLALGTLVLGILAWTGGSLYIMRGVTTPRFDTLAVTNDYELRRYPQLVVAEVARERAAAGDENALFPVLANFIFGGNDESQQIAMTAPVLMDPVERGERDSTSMRFIMPESFTLETLPTPTDQRVKVREVPSRTVAARVFHWFASDATREAELLALKKALERDGVKTVGKANYAAYQPPFAIPFMKKYEMQIEVAVDSG